MKRGHAHGGVVVIKRSETLMQAASWMSLENIMLVKAAT